MAMVLRKSSARWSPRKNGGGRSGISQNGNAYLDGFSDAWGTWQNPAVLPDAPTSAARDLGQERPDVPPARRRSLQAQHPGGGGALSGRRPLRIGNSRSGDRGGDAQTSSAESSLVNGGRITVRRSQLPRSRWTDAGQTTSTYGLGDRLSKARSDAYDIHSSSHRPLGRLRCGYEPRCEPGSAPPHAPSQAPAGDREHPELCEVTLVLARRHEIGDQQPSPGT